MTRSIRRSVACAALFALACGSRTTLPAPEPCAVEGARERCFDPCGEGARTCSDGYWHDCVVPTTSRPCSNDCGDGVEECHDGVWETACTVPDATRPCTNDCGSGTETCHDGTWETACVVAPAERSCTDPCGTGTEQCIDGQWLACDVPVATRPCSTVCGNGTEQCIDGEWKNCDAPQPKPPKLRAVIRDFLDTHPDMERSQPGTGGVDYGIVEPILGDDDTPVYAGNPDTPTTSGASYFHDWYHDTPGVNMTTTISLQLLQSPGEPGVYVYPGSEFFPIDGQLFGNQGRVHNYHFTLAIATQFKYIGGETFSFAGDDDLWVFINRHLAIDLGGLHQTLSASVDLDSHAAEFGIAVGNVYSLHLFFAERHTVESNFNVETTIADVPSCQ